MLVCWDQWFPEGARLTAMQGAEILFYPTAIGWHPSEKKQYGAAQHDSWEVMQRSHAIANGCYVCVPNRIGHEIIKDAKGKPVDKDGIVFWGQSFVASPDGQVVKRAPVDKETVWSSTATSRRSSSAARTGRSCAIAGSTPTAT